MFEMDQSKTQAEEVTNPASLPPDVIASPDALRTPRVPPGQSRTRKWPVLDAAGPPHIAPEKWKLRLVGNVTRPAEWTWEEFQSLPRVKPVADCHCVTRWARLGH